MLNLDVALSLEKPRDSHQPEAFALAAKLESDLASNIIGIFGPSGCGKSTLLKVIAGISLTEFSGRSLVSIDEVTQNELGPHQRDVAFVGQKDPLFPHLTVEQNLDFVTRHGAFAADCAFSTQEVIDWCGIHALLPKSVAYLSGGECQRVLFARALLSGKSLLLLDEAFSALDWSARQDMLLLVVKLHREHNLRFILVSHSLKELALSCDHIWQMDAGRLVAEGPSPVMVHQLALNRSAPTLSQLQVRFVARDEEFGVCRWRLDSEGQSFELYSHLHLYQEAQTHLVIEANKVVLSSRYAENSSMLNQVSGEVEAIHLDSQLAQVVLNVAGQKLIAEISKLSCQRLNLAVGLPVYAQFKLV